MRKRREFVGVYSKGRRVGSSSFTIYGLPNNAGHCRLGMAVSRKVGGAVTRNRVKRLLREIFRRNHAGFEPALDLVVNAHPVAKERTYRELEREFLRTFERVARGTRR